MWCVSCTERGGEVRECTRGFRGERDRQRQRGREREWGIRGWLCFGLLLITIIILCPVFHSAVRAHLSPRLCVRHYDCLVFKKPSVSLCSDKCFSNTNHSWVHLIWICERGFDSISRMLLQARHRPFNTVATCESLRIFSPSICIHCKGFERGLPSPFKPCCSLIPFFILYIGPH